MDLPLSLAQDTVQSMSVPQSLGSAVRHTRFILRHRADLLGKGPCRGRAHYRHNSLQQLYQQAFHFRQPPTAFHSRGTRPSPRTVVLRSPFPSQRARSKSAPPQLKFSALAFPPWLWKPALAWSWSQPRHKLGTRWSWREGRRLTSSLCSLPPCACDGTTHPSLPSSEGCHKAAAHFPAKTAATPLVPKMLLTSALEHTGSPGAPSCTVPMALL